MSLYTGKHPTRQSLYILGSIKPTHGQYLHTKRVSSHSKEYPFILGCTLTQRSILTYQGVFSHTKKYSYKPGSILTQREYLILLLLSVFFFILKWPNGSSATLSDSLTCKDLWGQFNKSFPLCILFCFVFLESGYQLACTESTLVREYSFIIISACLATMDWSWSTGLCELVSLTDSHTMPAQHSQPTTTPMGQGCMCA